ncbi:MAG: DUF4234 domain-containing protein [Solirubrobacteraceae bacterium]
MAETVQISRGGSVAKIRNPVAVMLLSLVTLGIYYLFWYYFINREMRDLGEARGVDIGHSPATSVIAVTLGSFIIVPPFVSHWKVGTRMERAQQAAGVVGGNGVIYFILWVIPLVSIVSPFYMQTQLNEVWRALQNESRTAPAAQLGSFDDSDMLTEPVGSPDESATAAEPIRSPEGLDEPGASSAGIDS